MPLRSGSTGAVSTTSQAAVAAYATSVDSDVLAHREWSWLSYGGRGSPSTLSQDPECSGHLINIAPQALWR